MKRYKHSLSHYVLSTFDMGQLVPVANYEVLPGDSVRMSTSALLRVSPLVTPVMHPVSCRIHHWFVPFRIIAEEVGENWENFITGGEDGTGDGAVVPKSGAIAGPGIPEKTLGDYLGIPTGVAIADPGVNLWSTVAYEMIVNEFYRDQDLVTRLDSHSVNQDLFNIAWGKDYFTAARPWAQKGPEVTLPLAGSAPVVAASPGYPTFQSGASTNLTLQGAVTADVTTSAPLGGAGTLSWDDPNLAADLASATGASVNDVRLAFAVQRYQEARAQYGSRFSEYLAYLGVRSSDARLQRPEYLGGGKSTISFSEVLKTGEGDTPDEESPIGELRGHGIAALRTRTWVRYFEEHGVVLALASLRPKSIYMDGLNRSWTKSAKEDYWQKELEQIGQQEIRNDEVYLGAAAPSGTFGFGDRYSEYRSEPSRVCGEFRSTLNDWHLARSFGAEPALNSDFVECVPSKRIFAEQTQNSIWGMFSHSIQARRMVGHKTIGRIF